MRPESHIIGDVGQKAIALLFTEWGWTADVIHSDYGEDLDCHVFIESERTPLHFRCQVKSTDDASKRIRRLKSGDFSIRISSETCRGWLFSYYPVLLVIYDRKSKAAFWADATAQIQEKVTSLHHKELTLHVSRSRMLEGDQARVISVLTSFYARLFKVHSESVERMVFPVLMPGYRVIPLLNARELFRVGLGREGHPEHVSVHRDTLPAWTTTLRTLDGPFFYGMSVRAPNVDLAQFDSLLTAELSTVAWPLVDGEWLAFVCSPIRFSIKGKEGDARSFGRDLTGWWSFAKIGDNVISDHEYAFELPKGFVRQIGRRARSWPGYFFVSSESDVAIQLLAGVATTPAERLFRSTLREHMLGQFLPWECPMEEVKELQRQLWSADLVFAQLEGYEYAVDGIRIVGGAISTPMFDPAIGIIPQAQSWAELAQGTVRGRLEKTALISFLPGKEGSPELKEKLLGLVSYMAEDVPDSWIVDGSMPESGLPIDLSNRQVVVQRFRPDVVLDPDQVAVVLQNLKYDIDRGVLNQASVQVGWDTIENFRKISVLTVSWSPSLEESSAQAVQRALPIISKSFDQILPRASSVAGTLTSSLDVLRFIGEVYFEGDRLY